MLFNDVLSDYRNDFNEYFGENVSPTHERGTYNDQQSVSSTNVYVSECLFKNCSSNSQGGAISTTSTQKLLVESSQFESCETSTGYGGAICIMSTASGQCIINKVCSIDCMTTSTSTTYGQFLYTELYDSLSTKNNCNPHFRKFIKFFSQ